MLWKFINLFGKYVSNSELVCIIDTEVISHNFYKISNGENKMCIKCR